MTDEIAVEVGSGNVFADLGLRDPEERLTKAELASRIDTAIREAGLTQAAAAALLGIDQPKVSRLMRGYLTNFSAGQLMNFLTLLGRDVEIVVKRAPGAKRRGQVRVVEAASI